MTLINFKLSLLDDKTGEELTSRVLDTWEVELEDLKANKRFKEEVCRILSESINLKITPEMMNDLLDKLETKI